MSEFPVGVFKYKEHVNVTNNKSNVYMLRRIDRNVTFRFNKKPNINQGQ